MKLQNVIDKFKSLGYKDFIIRQENGHVVMSYINQSELSEGTKNNLIREFGIRIEQKDNEIIIIL